MTGEQRELLMWEAPSGGLTLLTAVKPRSEGEEGGQLCCIFGCGQTMDKTGAVAMSCLWKSCMRVLACGLH